MNNIRNVGVFDFNNNPNTRVRNSQFSSRVNSAVEVIANDPSGTQCNNVVNSDLDLIGC